MQNLDRLDGSSALDRRPLPLTQHVRFDVVRRFVQDVGSVDNLQTLRALIEASSKELGFPYFAIVHHIRFGRPTVDKVRLTNYPMEWIAILRERLNFNEPVMKAAERTSSGFVWSRLGDHVPLGQRERDYMAEAARHGLAEGFTVPNHVPGEDLGSCNFAVERREDFPEESLPAAQALGCFAFEAARRLVERNRQPTDSYLSPAALSDRQRDCVLFAARGKSDSVIAQLLNIKPRTVNEHIEAAKRRYLVATRTQLIVRALFRSEICFSEVID